VAVTAIVASIAVIVLTLTSLRATGCFGFSTVVAGVGIMTVGVVVGVGVGAGVFVGAGVE